MDQRRHGGTMNGVLKQYYTISKILKGTETPFWLTDENGKDYLFKYDPEVITFLEKRQQELLYQLQEKQ